MAHRMVAQAFIKNPEGKREVNHKDGNKANNDVGNLEWATRSENTIHAYANGLINPAKKLSPEIAATIRSRYVFRGGPNSAKSLAAEYGISKTTIGRILSNRIWRQA